MRGLIVILFLLITIVIPRGVNAQMTASPNNTKVFEAADKFFNTLNNLHKLITPFIENNSTTDDINFQVPANPANAAVALNSYRELFQEVEARVGVPSRILEGVWVIEAPGDWKNFTAEQIQMFSAPGGQVLSCRRNECSAAGLMQMTTGFDGQGRSHCPECDGGKAGYCPNMWDLYRSSVNKYGGYSHVGDVCNLRDNVYGAAEKLKKDSGTTSQNWTREQVYQAARSYYGSCSNNYRYTRLGKSADGLGKTYCEFLWDYYQMAQ